MQTDGVKQAGEILKPALLLWLCYWLWFAVSNAAWVLLMPDGRATNTTYLVWTYSTQLGVIGVTCWFALRDPVARRFFVQPRPRMIEMCIILMVGGLLVLYMWVGLLGDQPGEQLMERTLELPIAVPLVTVALLPAVFEELMFRGLVLDRFARVLPLPLAIAVQAMMFAVVHLDPVFLLSHFAFGVLTGVLRMAAGALWPAVLAHLLWNAVYVLEVYEVF